MNLADVFAVLFAVLATVAVFIGYWLMAAGLFPRFVEGAAERFGKAPLRLPIIGVLTLGPLLVLGGKLSELGPNGGVKLIGIAMLLLGLLAALFGSAGLAHRIGTGLRAPRDEAEPWRRMLRGGVVLGLTFILPFIGTFVILPYAFFAGFGAFVLGLRRARVPVLAVAPPALP